MLLAGWHFVYESILVPTMRLGLRYKLFAIRDRLRMLKSCNHDEIPEVIFDSLNHSANVTINNIPYITISALFSAKKIYDNDILVRKEIDRRIKGVNECKVAEIQSLNRSLIKCAAEAFIINSGGWLLYALPFAIIVFILAIILQQISQIKSSIKGQIQQLTYLPEKKLSQFIDYPDMALSI